MIKSTNDSGYKKEPINYFKSVEKKRKKIENLFFSNFFNDSA